MLITATEVKSPLESFEETKLIFFSLEQLFSYNKLYSALTRKNWDIKLKIKIDYWITIFTESGNNKYFLTNNYTLQTDERQEVEF